MSNSISSSLNSSLCIYIDSTFLCVSSSGKYQISVINSFISKTSLVNNLCIFRNVIFSKVIMLEYINNLSIFSISFLVLRDTYVTSSNCWCMIMKYIQTIPFCFLIYYLVFLRDSFYGVHYSFTIRSWKSMRRNYYHWEFSFFEFFNWWMSSCKYLFKCLWRGSDMIIHKI